MTSGTKWEIGAFKKMITPKAWFIKFCQDLFTFSRIFMTCEDYYSFDILHVSF